MTPCKRKVLFIDENNSLLTILKTYFETEGAVVETVSEWHDEIIKDVKRFDCIFVDSHFKQNSITGYDICKKIKGCRDNCGNKVYIFSGYDEDSKKKLDSGADGYIEKGINGIRDIRRVLFGCVEGD